MSRADVLVLSLGTTHGLTLGDRALAAMLSDAGASVAVSAVRIGAGNRLRRGYPVNDLVEAAAARRALGSALDRVDPWAVIFSTTTASLLSGGRVSTGRGARKRGSRGAAGRRYGIWLDSPAALNRPGRLCAPLWALERRAMAGAAVVMPWSSEAIQALPAPVRHAVVISPPVALPERVAGGRERLVVAYTPDPKAKDLELVVRAWARFLELEGDPGSPAPAGARLMVTGIEPDWAREFLARRGVSELPERLELAGMISREQFTGRLDRAAAFLSGARWEDFGQAPLEALAAGAVLVAAPGGGPFPALGLAGELAPRCVAADRSPAALARALAGGLELSAHSLELARYQSEARAALALYAREATVTRLAEEVLPRLLG